MSSPLTWPGVEESNRQTAEAFADPQVGERFSEQFAFWVYVIGREETHVTTMEASPPCAFPDDATVRHYTLVEFRARFDTCAGPWVDLVDRGNDVGGWLDRAKGTAEQGDSH